MMELLGALEPKQFNIDEMIYNELDDFSEVLFFQKGKAKVGFYVNHKKYFVLMKQNGFTVGDYGCTFNRKAAFIYQAHTMCDTFFIRKRQWHALMDEDNEINIQLKQRIIT